MCTRAGARKDDLVPLGWETDYLDYVRARSDALRRLGYALSGDWFLADDLVQITLLQLYRHWRRARPDTLDAYVRRILVNAYLSARRRRRDQPVARPPEPTAPADPDVATAVDIGRALAKLPSRQRTLVVLRYLEDLSVTDVAALLGISEGAVKSQTAHAMRTLRTALGEFRVTKE
jgi:RNA polymerase sigma-70 factor (sigma-E family)